MDHETEFVNIRSIVDLDLKNSTFYTIEIIYFTYKKN